MKRVVITLIFLMAIGFVSGQEVAKQNLSAAIYEEEANGDLDKAIEMYKTIVNQFSNNRSVAAKAQFHIGLCYEKLGKKQAAEAYKKVIEQYADQHQTAEVAKTRLKNLYTQIASKQNTPVNPIFNQIVLDKEIKWPLLVYPSPYDFSIDGENFVYGTNCDTVPGLELYVANISGPPSTRLVTTSEFEMEVFPKYYHDGKNISFFGRKKGETRKKSGFYIVNKNGGKPQKISSIVPVYSPDGQYYLHIDGNSIYIRNLSGDTINSFSEALENSRLFCTNFSPDSKWISYSVSTSNYLVNVDCWLHSLTGDKHIRLTNRDGFDGYGTWSEKDYSLYFASDRNGNRNIFRLKIDPETGNKKADAEQVTFYKDANATRPLFLKNRNALVYCLTKSISEIVISENENFESFKTIATGTYPILSPNGTTVYFAGAGKDNQGIYSVLRAGGMRKSLTNLAPFQYVYSLSPDGKIISFFTKNNDDGLDLYFLSTLNNNLTKSITINCSSCKRGIYPTWSPDNETVAFAYERGLFTIPVWGNKIKKVNQFDTGNWDSESLRWSPDGTKIAGLYSNLDEDDNGLNDLVYVSLESGKAHRLTSKEENRYKEFPEWHPGSKKVTFVYYDEDDSDGIREAYIDGGLGPEIIDQPGIWDYFGKWDPTGTNYYFNGYDIGTYQIFKYNPFSKEITKLTDFSQGEYLEPYFSLSKDGKYMVVEKKPFKNQLWMMEGVE